MPSGQNVWDTILQNTNFEPLYLSLQDNSYALNDLIFHQDVIRH